MATQNLISISESLIRQIGLIAVLAGVLSILGFAIHPPTEDIAAVLSDAWVPAHVLGWLGFILAMVGWTGVYLKQASKAGALGRLGFFLLFLGTGMVVGIFFEAFAIDPIIASNAPSLGEVIAASPLLLIFLAVIIVFVIGAVLFGVSVIQAKVFPRSAGVLTILGSLIVLVAVLAALPEKIADTGGVIFGLSQVWLGYALWKR